jgi:hypothetical protein
MEGTSAAVWFDRGRSRVKQAQRKAVPDAAVKWNEALADFSKADQLQPGDGATLAGLAFCMSRRESFAAAVLVYDQATAAGFPAARLLNNRALCLLLAPQQHDPCDADGNARANLDAAIRQDPRLRAAYCNRAALAMRQWTSDRQQPIADTVIADLKRAIELGPPNGELFRLAAVASAAAAGHASLTEWDDCKERALRYLDLAVAYGQDPKPLARNSVLANLISAEEFAALSRIPVQQQTESLDRLVWVDPFDD